MRKQFALAHDVLRHSFCTCLYEQTGSLEKTAAESGNSVEMIRNHYRGALDHPEWTKKFWADPASAPIARRGDAGAERIKKYAVSLALCIF
ncbi:MAG: hypothetical protein ACREIA_14125 [Opitutaceae bacterium]